jgi:subtilase family serine protease
MLAGRWRCALLLFCTGLLWAAVGSSVGGQESPVDLRVSQIFLEPATSVVSGEVVTASVVVERSGPALEVDVPVEISWRRRDREEPCGATLGVFPAGDGPLALQFVATIPTADLAPGAYEIIVVVDPAGVIAEASESNNRLAASLEILAPKAELHPVRAEVTPTPPLLWGETATITAGVMNTGQAAAGPFHVGFALFPVYCVDERTGERWSVVPAGSANAKGLTPWLFVPDPEGMRSPQVTGLAALADAVPGDAWILFAEAQIAGLERDRRDDVYAVLSTGSPLRLLLTTSGARDGAIGSSSMAVLSSADADRIESCATTYAVRIWVEDAYGIADADPTNNILDMALSVRPSALELPDLLPIAASFNRPMPLNWDDDVDIDVLVANRGGGVAPSSGSAAISVAFSFRATGATSWTSLVTRTIQRLGIDEDSSTDTVTATIDASPNALNLTPGSYELRIVVDEGNAIAEQDERNNEIVLGFSVQGTELHPVGLEVPSASIRQGDSVNVVATIENTGERSLDSFTVGFYVGEVRFDTFTYRASATGDPGLERDDRTRVQGVLNTEDLVPGTYSLRVVVDPDNNVSELDETNNAISATITVLPPAERLAELYVSEVTLSPASPIPSGESVVARASVRNGGTMDAGRFSVTFLVVRDDGVPWTLGRLDCSENAPAAERGACACQATTGLERGASRWVEYAFSTAGWPEGRYILHVWVDPPTPGAADGEVRELDEANNEMVLSLSIGRPSTDGISDEPNLVIEALSLQPATAPAGATTTVLLATVANRGAKPAEPFFVDIRWMRADGATLSLARPRVDGLGPSQSVTLRQEIPLGSIGWTCGAHAFQVIVDSSGQVTEAVETDNSATVTYRVDGCLSPSYEPDLVVALSAPTARDGLLTAGCPAVAELTVANRGTLGAGAFRVELRQAGTVVGSQEISNLAAQGSMILHIDLNTDTPGTLQLSAVVDAERRVAEQSETNNAAELTVTVVARDASSVTRIGGPYRGAVGFVLLDSASGIVVAASDDGVLHAFARGSPPTALYDVSLNDDAKIAGLALDRGTAVRTAYVATASGTLHRFALSSGGRIGTAVRVGSTATSLALDSAGTAYVGTDVGVAVVKRTSETPTTLSLGARTVGLAIDTSGSLIYVLTPATLYAVSTATLTVVCSVGGFGGEATALALGPTGVYVGTSGGRVIAFSPCTSYGSIGTVMLRGWSADLSTAGGAIASLAVYPETAADPVYAALCEGGTGRIAALSLSGQPLWTYGGAGVPLTCPEGDLAVDRRRGRVSFAEASGTIRILSDRGEVLFVEDALAGLGKSIRSGVVMDSFVGESGGVSRFAELFYAGTSDGNLYVVETVRGGCP